MKLLLLLFLLLILPIIVFFTHQQQDIRQRARQTATISLIPSSSVVNAGEMVTIAIVINSPNFPINAANVALSYPSQKAEIVGIDTKDSAFEVENERVSGNGLLRLGRVSASPKIEHAQFATLIFRAKESLTISDFTPSGMSTVTHGGTGKVSNASLIYGNTDQPRQEANNSSLISSTFASIIMFFDTLNPF